MHKSVSVIGLTIVWILVLDVLVAGVLPLAERTGKAGSLIQYFEYGRSVPGKLDVWEDNPGVPGNLYDVAWTDELLERSAERFAGEDTANGPVVRSYGMSFVNRIMRQAEKIDPELNWDSHSGPGAPPNFTYAVFESDQPNRRQGDVAVLGILSSAVPSMAAMSNSTWAFEQPAPYTYPIFRLQGEGLQRIDPLVTNAEQFRQLRADPAARREWYAQLREQDFFYGPQAFGMSWLDVSPFARLVRRSVATTTLQQAKNKVIEKETYPYNDVLIRMVREFSRTAKADGQRPVVFLIQSRNPRDVDLLTLLKPTLDAEEADYLATAEFVDPSDPAAFLPDGHYKAERDQQFAEQFLAIIN